MRRTHLQWSQRAPCGLEESPDDSMLITRNCSSDSMVRIPILRYFEAASSSNELSRLTDKRNAWIPHSALVSLLSVRS